MRKRFLPALLALVMVLSLLPATALTALAAEGDPTKITEVGFFASGAKAKDYLGVSDFADGAPIVYVRSDGNIAAKDTATHVIVLKIGEKYVAIKNNSTKDGTMAYFSLKEGSNQVDLVSTTEASGYTDASGSLATDYAATATTASVTLVGIYPVAKMSEDGTLTQENALTNSTGVVLYDGHPVTFAEGNAVYGGTEIKTYSFKADADVANEAFTQAIKDDYSGRKEVNDAGADTMYATFWSKYVSSDVAEWYVVDVKLAAAERAATDVVKEGVIVQQISSGKGAMYFAFGNTSQTTDNFRTLESKAGTYTFTLYLYIGEQTGADEIENELKSNSEGKLVQVGKPETVTLKEVTFKADHGTFSNDEAELKLLADENDLKTTMTDDDLTTLFGETITVTANKAYTAEGQKWTADTGDNTYKLACIQKTTPTPKVGGQTTVSVSAADADDNKQKVELTLSNTADEYVGYTVATDGFKVFSEAGADVSTSVVPTYADGKLTLTFAPITAVTTYEVKLTAKEDEADLLQSEALTVKITPANAVAKLDELAIAEFGGAITGDVYSGETTTTKYYIVNADKMSTVNTGSWNKETTWADVKTALGVGAEPATASERNNGPVSFADNGKYLVVAVYNGGADEATLLAFGQTGPIATDIVKKLNISVSSSGAISGAVKTQTGNDSAKLRYAVVDGSQIETVNGWYNASASGKGTVGLTALGGVEFTETVPTLENGKNLVVVEQCDTYLYAAGYAAINLGSASDEGGAPTPPSQTQQPATPTDPEPTTPAEPEIEEVPVEVEEVTATVDETTGKAAAEVTEEAMDEAVEEAIAAIAEAEAEGEEVAPVVTIPVKVAEGAKNIEVKLPAKSVEKLAETKTAALEVKSDVGEVKLDNTALKALAESIDENSTITLEIESEVAEDELTAEQIAAIEEINNTVDGEDGDAELIDVTLYVNDQPKGDFGGGSIEVTVPAPKNATASNVRVYYLNDQGKLERMSGVRVVDGKVKFKTTHLSKYIISTKALLPELPFTDVPEDAWYMNELAWAYEKGIAKGLDEAGTMFGPGVGCTRAQFITFLWRACGEPKAEAEVKFTDVDPAQYSWAMDAIKWGVANKIITGMDDEGTIFEPETVCTRAQAVTMMYRADGQPDIAASGKFTDVPEGEYYTNAVAWAVAMKITEGATDTTFEPASPCIRAQMVVFLYRMFNPSTGMG